MHGFILHIFPLYYILHMDIFNNFNLDINIYISYINIQIIMYF